MLYIILSSLIWGSTLTEMGGSYDLLTDKAVTEFLDGQLCDQKKKNKKTTQGNISNSVTSLGKRNSSICNLPQRRSYELWTKPKIYIIILHTEIMEYYLYSQKIYIIYCKSMLNISFLPQLSIAL
jgi:hypothetical protein